MRMARDCYLRSHSRHVVKFNTAAGATLRPISSIVITTPASFTTCDDTSTCGRRYFGTNTIFADRAFEGVSDEVSKQILHHARQPQTAVSLKTLLQTGRGEFLHKTYKQLDEDDNHRGATGKVLMQVASFLRRELPIRLAHRITDLERVPYMSEMPSVVGVKKLYTQSS
ncbi:Mitochondrial branched-chain alpha-ketoacid dehydrogenase kinase [Fragilaria crotonensis]|nr:Mitochondrial branched-chain alpha-ketoacid dehydrogenase kinase [Fragilaria crotonensis]